MRFLLGLVALVLLIGVIALSTGLVTLNGSLGSVKVSTTPPDVTANVAKISVGTENKTIAVPTIKVEKPGAAPAGNAAAPQ